MARGIVPLDEERRFGIEELFFSITDERGVITSGNEVFARVSGYSIDELLGKPHNIIRHPDVPRAVFYLLWDYLKAGKAIAAYVKNMAKDGRYYWVMALVTPIQGRYLSIRLKPTSPIFAQVKQIYAELLALEASYGNKPGARNEGMLAAAARLGEILASIGFDSYDSFMHTALVEELKQRDSAIEGLREASAVRRGGSVGAGMNSCANRPAANRPPDGIPNSGKSVVFIDTPSARDESESRVFRDAQSARDESESGRRLEDSLVHCRGLQRHFFKVFGSLENYLELYDNLLGKSRFVQQLSHSAGRLSINATIASAHLREDGACLSVVAQWMRQNSEDINGAITELAPQMRSVADGLKRIAFQVSVSRLTVEMMAFFLSELSRTDAEDAMGEAGDNGATESNLRGLSQALTGAIDDTYRSMEVLNGGLSQLSKGLDDVLIPVRTVGFAHVIGKVEASRLRDATVFTSIFEEVSTLIQDARRELEELIRTIATASIEPIQQSRVEAFTGSLRQVSLVN
jgi:aerotaxis receptor